MKKKNNEKSIDRLKEDLIKKAVAKQVKGGGGTCNYCFNGELCNVYCGVCIVLV